MRMPAIILAALLFGPPALTGELPPNQWAPVNEPPMGVQLLGWDEIRYVPDLQGVLFGRGFGHFPPAARAFFIVSRFFLIPSMYPVGVISPEATGSRT